MKQILFKSLLTVLITLVGAQNLMADQGPWKNFGWKKGYYDSSTHVRSYNGLDGSDWGGAWYYYDDYNGMHIYNNCPNGNIAYYYMVYYILAYATIDVPSYCKIKRNETYHIYASSDQYVSKHQVLFYDNEYAARNTVINSATGWFQVYGKKYQVSDNKTATLYYDNSTGSVSNNKCTIF